MLSCSVGAVNDCNEGGFHAKTVPATTSGSWKNSSSGRRSNTSLLPINPRTTSPSPLGMGGGRANYFILVTVGLFWPV